ncbi:MAG: DUF434 domain-containing protein [Candidatus Odinarchaeia archaeon]
MKSKKLRLNLIFEAAEDLRFLLSRGYNRPTAIKFVGDKYLLNRYERQILFRSVFPKNIVAEVQGKTVTIENIRGTKLAIDGYNVLITLEAILKGDIIILCEDGIIRDISGVFEKYKVGEYTFKALTNIFELLSKHRPKETIFLLDSPISKSGDLAALINDYFKEFRLPGEAKTSKKVDSELLLCEIVATSDHIILNKASKVLDIPSHFLKLYKKEPISFKIQI